MSIQQILTEGSGLLLVLMTLVQIAPVKMNPWSWLAKTIGKAINADVSKRLNGIEKMLDAHVTMDDERNTDLHRAYILRFNTELLRNIPHTEEDFNEILYNIDCYERYCKGHPNYQNNRAVLAIKNIRDVYMERLKKHDFLQVSSIPRQEQTP